MSVMVQDDVSCPSCGAGVSFDVCFSVNGGRHPHLRAAILDGSFQRVTCEACHKAFRLSPEFSYLDAGRAQWILVRPPGQAALWEELEDVALEIFGGAFGVRAPPAARELGSQLSPRVVFGWPALREKLVAAESGLDDVTLELTKLLLVRALDAPLADDVELRLLAVEGDTLLFGSVRPASGVVIDTLEAPRGLYDDVAADQAGWAAVRAELDAGPFVDLDRLFVTPESPVEAPATA